MYGLNALRFCVCRIGKARCFAVRTNGITDEMK